MGGGRRERQDARDAEARSSARRHDIEVIDAQVHIAPRDDPHPIITADEMRAVMAANRVDAAVATGRTRYDAHSNYLLETADRFAGEFAVIGSIDPDMPDLDERVRAWRSRPAMLGIRLVVLSAQQTAQWEQGRYLPVFAAAERYSVPICIWTPRRLHELLPVVRAYPDLRFVIDHLGLPQTTNACRRDDVPFERLPDLLAFARLPNVAVKLTGVPSLSLERFPYRDVWPALHKVLSAFGPERVMWGSNWRASSPYGETIDWIRDTTELSAAEKTLVVGGTLRKVLDWPRRGGEAVLRRSSTDPAAM